MVTSTLETLRFASKLKAFQKAGSLCRLLWKMNDGQRLLPHKLQSKVKTCTYIATTKLFDTIFIHVEIDFYSW